MKKIFKYPVSLGEFELALPKYYQILTVQMQVDTPYLWAIVNTANELELVNFVVRGTGHEFESESDVEQDYVGTFQMAGGGLIWHLFKTTPLM